MAGGQFACQIHCRWSQGPDLAGLAKIPLKKGHYLRRLRRLIFFSQPISWFFNGSALSAPLQQGKEKILAIQN